MVSIGIPTYNRRAYLARAIESVLNQTYRDIEVIVSDNASSDDTAQCVRGFSDPRIIFLQQTKNIGMIANFNACLHAATGDLFLMLSDDDLLEPTCIERLSAPFSSEEVGVAWCPVKILDSAGTVQYTSAAGPRKEAGWALVEGLFRGARGPRFCSVMVRKADALAAGGYHTEHGPICDTGNWSQIAVTHSFAVCVPETLSRYTMHQTSITSQASGAFWQECSERITSDLVALLEQRGEDTIARRIHSAGNDHTSNLIATVMLQYIGKPGWVKYWISEAIRAPRFLFAPIVFRRLFRDGWKLLRLYTKS